MSRFVADSSVGLKLIVDEPDSPKALELFATTNLIAPDIYPHEVRHVLSKLFRQKLLTEPEVRVAIEQLQDSQPDLYPSDPEGAFELALQYGCSYWDANFLQLAIREKIALITCDERFVKNVKRPDVILLSSL